MHIGGLGHLNSCVEQGLLIPVSADNLQIIHESKNPPRILVCTAITSNLALAHLFCDSMSSLYLSLLSTTLLTPTTISERIIIHSLVRNVLNYV